MKINVVPYNEEWKKRFKALQGELKNLLSAFNPVIEHFGSTAVPGLAAKDVIDIIIGIDDRNLLDQIVEAMSKDERYIYFEVWNNTIPNRRLFVRLKDDSDLSKFDKKYADLSDIPHELISDNRIAHVHVWENGSYDFMRHIAVRNYLKKHEQVKIAYGDLKLKLSKQEWETGQEYNQAKNDYLTQLEEDAIDWYLQADKL